MTRFDDLVRDAGELACQSSPELFFEREKDDETDLNDMSTSMRFAMAKKLCNDCPLRQACLHHAIVNNIQYGVWGQTTPTERYYIKKA